ncbi:hypothetical protein COM54_15510 [Bacillus toyonensis]|nr:hypothetical protein COM54_15510 [Bacillus toyonensis]
MCQGKLNKKTILKEFKQIIEIQNIRPRKNDLLMQFDEIPDENVQNIVECALAQINNGEVELSRFSNCFEIIQILIKEKIINLDKQNA